MDNVNEKFIEIDKKLEYLSNATKPNFTALWFSSEDLKTENNGYKIIFNGIKNSQALIEFKFSGIGAIKVFFGGVYVDGAEVSSESEAYFNVNIVKGENDLFLDCSQVTGFVLSSCIVYGFVERKNFGSKIYSINAETVGLLTAFDGLNGKARIKVCYQGGDTAILTTDCSDIAVSKISADYAAALAVKSDRLTAYLISLDYYDVMDSTDLPPAGVVSVAGAAGGVFYAVNADASISKYVIDEYLDLTVTQMGERARKVIASPTDDRVIFVGTDGKARLTSFAGD